MELNPGDVIRWNDFPHGRDKLERTKPFWFIVWFTPGSLDDETDKVILHRFTGQWEKYEKGGEREKNPHRTFRRPPFDNFDSTCVLDFTEEFYDSFTLAAILKYKQDIEPKGKIAPNQMPETFHKLLNDGEYSKKQKRLIRSALQRAGYSGLKEVR